MENDKFNNLTDRQKRQKLKFILKNATQGCLNDAELNLILEKIKFNRQYGIKLYYDVSSYENALIVPQASLVEVVLGSVALDEKTGVRKLVNADMPVAIIIRRACESDCNLHVYIPKCRRPKLKKGKETPKVLCQQNCVGEKYICHHMEYNENSIFCTFNPPKEVKNNV